LLVAEVLESGAVRPLLDGDGERKLADLPAPLEPPEPGTLMAVRPLDSGTLAPVLTLAAPGTALGRVHRVAAAAGLTPYHPPEVEQEAAALQAEPGFDAPDLVDLRHLPFVTIDYLRSRDLDQAVHVQAEAGGYVVRYALADAAYYVRPGTALMREALRRGASYYLPGLTIPMLPRVLCEDIISLNEGVDRRAVVVEMRLDADGSCLDARLLRARIRSRRKLTYVGVQSMLDRGPGHPLAEQPFAGSLRLMAEVGRLRMAEAVGRGVVRHRRAEVNIDLVDDAGTAFRARATPRLSVERYNEQISLLTNIEGASLLAAARGEPDLQAVFRVHAEPPPEKLDALERLADALVREHKLDPAAWRWRGETEHRRPMADWLAGLPGHGHLAGIRQVVEHHALRSNVRSLFDAAPARHHGVGAAAYARFSAPMREVVGIFTHKEALELLGMEPGAPPGADEALREAVIEAGNRAHTLQRKLDKKAHKLLLDQLFRRDLRLPGGARRWRRGVLLGLRRSRGYVILDELPLELKLYAADLAQGGERLTVDRAGVSLQIGTEPDGRWLVGDRIEVAAAGHDDRRDRWRFAIRRPIRSPRLDDD